MSSRAGETEGIGTAGTNRVMADFEDLGWGPVENSRHDLGIDLFLQVRDQRRFDRNALVMAQVKSGPSYFEHEVRDEEGVLAGWWYYEEDATHFEDWVQHGQPHLLVLHEPAGKVSYWVHVTKEAVAATGNGFKIRVPVTNRVDEANRDALLVVAASAKSAPVLQGTSVAASAKAVAPGRALRHAMLAPRLIAPHANSRSERAIEPEEAVALLTQGRLPDLDHFVRQEGNRRLSQACATSRDWRWRFFAAYKQFVTSGGRQPILDLAVATQKQNKAWKKRHPEWLAACLVASAVLLTDAEQWEEAIEVLAWAGEDLPPIDHAWVLVHRAVVLAQLGQVDRGRTTAASAQQTVNLDPDDVTAAAISAAAAELIFYTAGWGEADIKATLTAGDTAVSWWRSQTTSTALSQHDEESFAAWARCDDVDGQYADTAQQRLYGTWLSASFAGTRSSATASLATRAHHELVHHEVAWRAAASSYPDSGPPPRAEASGHDAAQARRQNAENGLAEALDQLRRYGRHKDLESAVKRLWAAGPAEPIRIALRHSAETPWTHTNARAKLALLEHGGDLLDAATANVQVQHCLDVITDPATFARKVRPTFAIHHFVYRALGGVLPAADDSGHEIAIRHLLQTLPRAKSAGVEDDLLRIVVHLRPSALAALADEVRTAALEHSSLRLSVAVLGALLVCGDPEAEAVLMRRAESGDRDAVAELGTATALTPTAAAALIAKDAAGCRDVIAKARRGAYGFGGWDSARALTVANLHFPELANWEPVLELVLDPNVAYLAKVDTISVLTTRANELPDSVAATLRQAIVSDGAGIPGFALQREEDLSQAVFSLGLAVGAVDTVSAMRRVVAWLRGSASQRQTAGWLIEALRGRAHDLIVQGTLITLTGDSQYQIRAAAAVALLRGLSLPTLGVVDEAIVAAAHETGCVVPLAVARTIHTAPDRWTRKEDILLSLTYHPSARVRSAATRP